MNLTSPARIANRARTGAAGPSGRSTEVEALAGLTNLLHASGSAMPLWFTQEYVARVKERMRKLEAGWKGTLFGSTMTLQFSVE